MILSLAHQSMVDQRLQRRDHAQAQFCQVRRAAAQGSAADLEGSCLPRERSRLARRSSGTVRSRLRSPANRFPSSPLLIFVRCIGRTESSNTPFLSIHAQRTIHRALYWCPVYCQTHDQQTFTTRTFGPRNQTMSCSCSVFIRSTSCRLVSSTASWSASYALDGCS
jgi:hypothetical protein